MRRDVTGAAAGEGSVGLRAGEPPAGSPEFYRRGESGRAADATIVPALSIVIPVFNEEQNLPVLFARLYPVLDEIGRSYEVLFTNDGSVDRSLDLLRAQFVVRPDVTRVLDFNANYGQHMAIMAAFERVRGNVIVTLDADLQNPPEEIPKLLAAIEAGHDYVGGVRRERKDPLFRTWASRLVNAVRERATDIRMTDHGCMLRAYRRPVVEAMVRSGASSTFIPALAYSFAQRRAEVSVRHEARHAGVSSYSLAKLIRLNFDLITSFSLAPLQWFTAAAMACFGGSLVFLLIALVRRLMLGAAEGGLLILFGVLFVLLSGTMVGIGFVGEYAGRAYHAVRHRPRYQVRELIEAKR